LKVCTKCKVEKSLEEFKKRKDTASGYRTTCKQCDNENRKQWYQNTIEIRREKQVKYDKKYYEKNHEVCLERCRAYSKNNRQKKTDSYRNWRHTNPEKAKEANKRNRHIQYAWRKEHPEVYRAHSAKRRALEISATPPWLTKQHLDEILQLYKSAQTLKEFHEEQYDVDHIEPLAGKTCCGLHVPWNLQVLSHRDNLAKSNKLITNLEN
jgi:hypothetical protein